MLCVVATCTFVVLFGLLMLFSLACLFASLSFCCGVVFGSFRFVLLYCFGLGCFWVWFALDRVVFVLVCVVLFACWFVGWLVRWLVGLLVCLSVGWSIGWLVGCALRFYLCLCCVVVFFVG